MVRFTVMQILAQRPFGFGYFLIAEHAGKLLKEVLSNGSMRYLDTGEHMVLLLFVMTDG